MRKLKQLTEQEKNKLEFLIKFYNLSLSTYSDYSKLSPSEYIIRHKEKEYVAIPYSYQNFIETLFKIRKYLPQYTKFLDIGCGKGNILNIAKVLGFSTYGIEFRKEYSIHLTHHMIKFIRAENCKDYNKFDVLFFYNILKRDEDMIELLDIVIKQMKEGALIYLIGPTNFKNLAPIQGDSNLFIKKL